MSDTLGVIRKFTTRNLTVVIDAIPDDDLDLSWDDDGSVRTGLESGEFMAFIARARVLFNGNEIASDYLGGCVYRSLSEFADHIECARYNRELASKGDTARCGSYFAEMVRKVCEQARDALRAMQSIRVRS